MNDFYDTDMQINCVEPEKKQGRSCASCLFGLVMSSWFLFTGILFSAFFIYLQAPAGYATAAGAIFVFAFFWQRRAARLGCFMPFFIIAAFVIAESMLLGMLIYETDAYKKVDLIKVREVVDTHAPGLYEAVGKSIAKAAKTIKTAVEGFRQTDDEKKLALLEDAFRNNPADPDAVLALADAYMGKNDLVSTQFAIALCEALVDSDPCDSFLMRLADAYARIYRYDLAFATAVRRTWLPHATMEKAARQIAMFAVISGNLARGIFEIEKILQLSPPESDEITLILAGLYRDIGNERQAQILLDSVITNAPAASTIATTAVEWTNEQYKAQKYED